MKVPSFWMFAWTRSLMNRASRSSSYSPPQNVFSREASPALLARVLFPSRQSREHGGNVLRPRSWIARRARTSRAERRRHSSARKGRRRPRLPPPAPAVLHVRLARAATVAARVASQRIERERHASLDRGDDRALDTPLQLPTCASSGMSRHSRAAVRRASGKRRSGRSGSGPRDQELQERRRRTGVAEQDRAPEPAIANDQLLVDAARRLAVVTSSSSGPSAPSRPSRPVDPHHLQFRRHARPGGHRVRDATP